MTRTRRLRPVVQHTDKKEQQALQQVAQSQGLLEIEQVRQAQLQDYKLEYLQKKKHDIGVFTPLELQEFNRFMQQLDETIERQMDMVEIARWGVAAGTASAMRDGVDFATLDEVRAVYDLVATSML